MTTGDFNVRKPNIRKRPKDTIPTTDWDDMVVDGVSSFKKRPPLKFTYVRNDGLELVFRLVKRNNAYFVYSVELIYNDEISKFDYLYYWKSESQLQCAFNDIMNIPETMRWADTFTASRNDGYIDNYNHIEEMLQNLGVDIEETF